MNKKILVPIMVTTLAVSSIPVSFHGGNGYNIVKAEEQLLTENVDGMVIENGILKRYEGNASEIVVPEGVVSIGEYAFEYKDFIQSITLPESVVEIGSYAFFKCYNLEEVQIKGTIENIGTNAFSVCEKLATIDLSNVKQIGYNSFHGCMNLKEIELSALEKIETLAFSASGLEKVNLHFVGEDNLIEQEAFLECENLKEIVIEGEVSKIGDKAFFGCKVLESIQIEDSSKINYIGKRSFDQTPWLTEQLEQSENKMLIINDILVKYQPEVFYAGEYEGILYEDLSEEEQRTKVNDSNFTYTPPSDAKMETVTIPGNVKAIAGNAFYGAYSVEKIIFDSNIKEIEIGEGVFDFTTWEKEYLDRENFLVIGGTLVKVKCNAEVIEIPNGVKTIISGALMKDCTTGKIPTEEIVDTKEIIIPQSVKEGVIVQGVGDSLEKLVVPTSFESSIAEWNRPSYLEFKDVDTSVEAKDVLGGYEKETPSPTAAVTEVPSPTTVVTNTPSPTAAVTEVPSPTTVVANTPSPTAAVTETPSPTAAVTEVPSPTAVVTETPAPTTSVTETQPPTPTATQPLNSTVPVTQMPVPTAVITETPETPESTKVPNISTPKPVINVKRAVIKKTKRLSNKKIKVYIKKSETVKGYQIVASTNKKFKKNLKKVTTSGQSVTLKNLKKGKTYYIKVRAYKLDANKKKVYGKYSIIKKVK